MLKRYEYMTKNGKRWSQWFNSFGKPEQWQLKNKLRNEYKDENEQSR